MFFWRLWCVLGVLRLASCSDVAQIPDPDGDLHVYALPIGQGDATVIQCPKGAGGLTVFDIGSTKFNGFMTRSDVSRWLGTQRVDAVFLSHPHIDHYNFIDALSGNVDMSEGIAIFHSCNASSYKELPSRTAGWNASLVRVTRCVANDRNCTMRLPPCRNYTICGGRGVLRVLASELNNCITDPNKNSMVLKLEYEGTSFLLPGDLDDYYANYHQGVPIPEPNGPYGILLSCCDVGSTAMRIAHHGAYGRANKPGLHYRVNPQVALSSSGFVTSYGHPRCDIYDFYTKWISASASRPHILRPKLRVDYDLKHWYTCGNYSLGIWETKKVKEAIYVTSVCAQNLGAGGSELVNYIVEVNMKLVSGLMPGPRLTQFSAYNSSTFPETFPC